MIFETYVDRQIDMINEIDKIHETNEIDQNDRLTDEKHRYNHSTEISRQKCVHAGNEEIRQVSIISAPDFHVCASLYPGILSFQDTSMEVF